MILVRLKTNMLALRSEDTKIYDGAAVEAAIDASLAALQTSYLDLLQIHWPGNIGFQGDNQLVDWPAMAAEVVVALEHAVAVGKLKFYGLCNFGTDDLAAFRAAGGKPVRAPYQSSWRAKCRQRRRLHC
eukprot:SAG31_NODE_10931_length_1082_cov_1.093591_2_plen_129_part_00